MVDITHGARGNDESLLSLVAEALSPLEAVGDRITMARRVGNLLARTVAIGVRIDLVSDGAVRTLLCAPFGAERRLGGIGGEHVATAVEGARPGIVDDPIAGLCWVVVPLVRDDIPLGALSAALDRPSSTVSDADVRALQKVARSLSAALADADVHAHASHVSHTLQEQLLPTALPRTDWFDLAGRHVPGTAGLEIGGDWYDAQILDNGTLAFSVGDVSGHGVEAAARMGELRAATSALRLVRSGPDDLISVLHRLTAPMGYLATAICARLDVGGRLVWASAGHLPPLVARRDGSVEVIGGELSPPLGVGYEEAVPVQRATIHAGDAVLLYTDGLVERRDEPIDVSIDRLAARVGTLRWSTPTELIEGVLEGLGDDPQSTLDDVAVLAAVRLR